MDQRAQAVILLGVKVVIIASESRMYYISMPRAAFVVCMPQHQERLFVVQALNSFVKTYGTGVCFAEGNELPTKYQHYCLQRPRSVGRAYMGNKRLPSSGLTAITLQILCNAEAMHITCRAGHKCS